MTIVRKMYTGIGILAVVLIGLAVYFQISVRHTKADLEAIDKYREVQAGIAPMIVAHMKWAEGLAVGTILFGKEFTGQTDHTKCKFGEWYYSFTPPKEIEKTFREIEGPHKNLHATAPKITAAMHAGKQEAAKKIYQEETVPALTEVQNKLNALRNEYKDTIVGRMTGGLKNSQDSMLRTSVIVYASTLAALLAGFVFFLALPLKKSLLSIKKGINAMAAGDLKNDIAISSKDEIGDMTAELNIMAGKVRLMVSDADMLSKSAVEGKLAVRADATKHEGDYRKIIEGVNDTLDSVIAPLNMAAGYIERISKGEIPHKITDNYNGDFDKLKGNLNDCIDNLSHIISQTKDSADQVSSAADQISSASQNFSQKITEQAAAVEETSATIEEMSASIKQTAENSREANKLAQGTKTLADSGSQVMEDTIKAMDEINRSSNKIANISNVIEEIAFQTNLLALNAAVEAARAGEHGKGFAVVASEIRNLAGRTTESAKEINSLIEDSVEKTGRGVQLAQELSKKLTEIGGSIRKVTDLMNEVAAAAAEQASGTNQVNTAMTQIDQTTQQNASLVEETSAAAEELAAQAKELLGVISFFRIEGERSVSGRQPANLKSIGGKGDRTLAGHQAASGLHTTRALKHERLAADHKSPGMAAAGNGHNGHNNGFDEF